MVFGSVFWVFYRLYIRYLGFGKVYQVVYWSKGDGLICQRCLIVKYIEMKTTKNNVNHVLLIVIVAKYKKKIQVICEIARWLLPIMGRSGHQVEILSSQ